jgi:DNA-binding NtrC family response regulator
METLKAIREIRPETAVIMITGQMQVESSTEAKFLGAVASLQKPVDVEELLRVVNTCVKNP